MPYRFLADIVVIIHLLFILFVIFGGVSVLFRRALAWLHLPSVCWAVLIETGGWICPLTPLENWLRVRSSAPGGYQDSFVEHYLLPVIYPHNLTRETQWLIALVVAVINVAVYGLVLHLRKRQSNN